jgi:hypothetical protein
MQVAVRDTAPVHGRHERVEAIEERGVEIAAPERAQRPPVDVIERDRLPIDDGDQAWHARQSVEPAIGAHLAAELPRSEEDADRPRPRRDVLDDDGDAVEGDEIHDGLGAVAARVQPAAREPFEPVPRQPGGRGACATMSRHRERRSIAQEQGVSSIPVAFPGSLSVTVIKRGPWGKADILRLQHASGEAILKDYSAKSAPVRWFGRRQLLRERRALARLQGLLGVPADFGEVVPCGLLMESMHGEPITRWRRRPADQLAALFARLEALVAKMHERGVVHLDLRKRDNILIGADGSPSVIDFNASVCFAPGSIRARLFFPLLRRIDQSALLKWKAFLLPAGLSAAESRRHRRMRLLRRFWIFS